MRDQATFDGPKKQDAVGDESAVSVIADFESNKHASGHFHLPEQGVGFHVLPTSGTMDRGGVRMVQRQSFSGVIAAPYTPFDVNGAIDLGPVNDQVALFQEMGVTGVFICGTTGEGFRMTVEERMSLTERWSQVRSDGMRLFVHVGANTDEDSIMLSSHAAGQNVDAIAARIPVSEPGAGRNVAEVLDRLDEIASAAGETPVYFYDIPSLDGDPIATHAILERGRDRIRNLAGVKISHTDLDHLQRCLDVGSDHFEILFGVDEMLLSALERGVHGAVGSTYNYATPHYLKMIEAFDSGDIETARELQDRSRKLVDVLYQFGLLRAGKAIMTMMGVDCGPPRDSEQPLSVDDRRRLRDQIEPLNIVARPLAC